MLPRICLFLAAECILLIAALQIFPLQTRLLHKSFVFAKGTTAAWSLSQGLTMQGFTILEWLRLEGT